MKRKNKHCMERLETNRMILIHSNISNFLKKQHTQTYCFANRYNSDESSNSMDEKFFHRTR